MSGWTSARPGPSSEEPPRAPAARPPRAARQAPRPAAEPAPRPSADVDAPAYDEEVAEPHHGLPAGAHLHDRRGLTATGAVATALVLGVAGGAVDVLTGPGLRTVFAVCFVLGCGIAALTVHREDLVAAVVIPPLVYCVLALLAGAVEAAAGTQSLLTRQAVELVNALVLGAPVLLAATGLALVVALTRWWSGRTASG